MEQELEFMTSRDTREIYSAVPCSFESSGSKSVTGGCISGPLYGMYILYHRIINLGINTLRAHIRAEIGAILCLSQHRGLYVRAGDTTRADIL